MVTLPERHETMAKTHLLGARVDLASRKEVAFGSALAIYVDVASPAHSFAKHQQLQRNNDLWRVQAGICSGSSRYGLGCCLRRTERRHHPQSSWGAFTATAALTAHGAVTELCCSLSEGVLSEAQLDLRRASQQCSASDKNQPGGVEICQATGQN